MKACDVHMTYMEYLWSVPNQPNPGLGSVPRRSGVVRQCSTERSGLRALLFPSPPAYYRIQRLSTLDFCLSR